MPQFAILWAPWRSAFDHPRVSAPTTRTSQSLDLAWQSPISVKAERPGRAHRARFHVRDAARLSTPYVVRQSHLLEFSSTTNARHGREL
jgi:hypothetical protein